MSFHFPGTIALAVAIAAVVLGVIAAILPHGAPPGSR
jgi:hypothetical protein